MIHGQIVLPGHSTGVHFEEQDGNRVVLIADMLEWLSNELKEAHEADVLDVRKPLLVDIAELEEQVELLESGSDEENRG